jgi:hypothetical protein
VIGKRRVTIKKRGGWWFVYSNTLGITLTGPSGDTAHTSWESAMGTARYHLQGLC